jgi:hypothetical protein
MDGGAVALDWDGEERSFCVRRDEDFVQDGGVADRDADENPKNAVQEERGSDVRPGSLRASCVYDGHASIAYGADWGWRGGRSRGDVVVSCSFYDKGLHVWSPTPRDVLRV